MRVRKSNRTHTLLWAANVSRWKGFLVRNVVYLRANCYFLQVVCRAKNASPGWSGKVAQQRVGESLSAQPRHAKCLGALGARNSWQQRTMQLYVPEPSRLRRYAMGNNESSKWAGFTVSWINPPVQVTVVTRNSSYVTKIVLTNWGT